MKKIEAVIFDLDGLMIDSERFNFDCMAQLIARYGKQPQEKWFESMIGMDNYECAEFIISETDLPLSPEAYLQEINKIVLESLPEICTPNPGLMDLIQNLIEYNVKLGVASNSYEKYVKTALRSLGIIEVFDCIVSASDVEKGKPEPDIFWVASDCLGIEPEHCLVLEDSPHGMLGALDAGMYCAVIPNAFVKETYFTGATFVFSSLVELNQALPGVLNGSER